MKNNKYSDYKIFNFSEKLESFKTNKILAPLYVRIKPTNRCNHDCYWCVYADSFRKKNKPDDYGVGHIDSKMHTEMVESDIMPKDKLLETLDIFKDIGVKAVTYSGGGEPLFYKGIVEVMNRTISNNIDLSIITNGELLSGDRAKALIDAKWVRVSMDYTNASQMTDFRRVKDTSFNRVIENIKNFSKIKSRGCDLGVNYIIHKDNCQNLVEFTKFMKDLGVNNVRYSPMWLPDFAEYHKDIEKIVADQLSKIDNLIDDNFSVNTTYDISSKGHSVDRPYHKCYINQIVPVLGADLNVYTCHNKAYDDKGIIGSIKNQTFDQMWFSAETKKFFDEFNPVKSCKHQCSSDNKNIIINDYIQSSIDNFI
jgi:MoaA/NifB/PqqE/SkfB family radical SAM enzyme